jgi:hypothetical protein
MEICKPVGSQGLNRAGVRRGTRILGERGERMGSQLRLGGAVLFLGSLAASGCLYFNRCGCGTSSSCCCHATAAASTVGRLPSPAEGEQHLEEGPNVTNK